MPNSPTSPEDLVDLYLRLSVDREGKDSLERQEADLREWAARERLTVRRVWTDAGKSGYKRNVKRLGFDAALAALRSGEVKTLAVWKVDRLSRRGAGQIGLVLDDIEQNGGRLYFLRDGIDTRADGNQRMMLVLLSEQARAESANTSLRVRAKKDASRKSGEYLGGPAPFGYVVGDDRKLRQHPEEAPLVRELVDRLLAGEAMLAICRDWNLRGVPTRRGGSKWQTSTTSALVRSPALAGLMPEKRQDPDSGKWSTSTAAWRDPDTGETVSMLAVGEAPIVTESERLRLLDELDGRLRRYGRGLQPVKQPKSLLGGLIVCASCGRGANTFGHSYRCRKWHERGTDDCKAPLSVSVGAVEEAVKRIWATGLATLEPDDPILAAVADHWLAKFDPAPLQERRDLVGQLDDARARLTAADDDFYVRGTLDAERHARIARALDERIAALTARLRDLPEPEADLGALLDPEISLPAMNAADVHEARALLRLAIRRVEVSKAPHAGARWVPHERIRVRWVGEPDA